MQRSLLVVLCLGLGAVVGIAPDAQALTGSSACSGEFVNTDGHGSGSCELEFQGLPVGVQGTYVAGGDPPGRSAIHVELFVVLANGEERSLVECADPLSSTARSYGTTRCTKERNEAGLPVTLLEPLPAEVVGLRCEAHSHAAATDTVPGNASFACWSSIEAKGGSGVTPAGSGGGAVITAVPVNTYLPEVMVARASGTLDFVNLDLNRHDVVAQVRQDDGELRPDHVRADGPWCHSYEAGECPLFWTDLTSSGTTAAVEGLADAVPGTTYHFYCSIHPYMKGELIVID